MKELRIGDIARLTGRATETIRRFERAGRIPRARRQGRWRYWTQADLPAICAGLGVAPPPDPLDSLLANLERLAPVIMAQAEALLGGKTIEQAVQGLLGEQGIGEAMRELVRS